MNGNVRQKLGKALRQWTPLCETRKEKVLLGPYVRDNFESKMKSIKRPADPDWQLPVEIVESEDEFIINS
jgi:hypothetical protein